MVEKDTIPSEEQLRANCEKLTQLEKLDAGQFTEFVESFCLLVGEKPEEDPRQAVIGGPWSRMKFNVSEEEKGLTATLKWDKSSQKGLFGGIYASISFTKDQIPFVEKFDAEDEVHGFYSVEFSSILGNQRRLQEEIRFKYPSVELAGACRKVWEIYNSPKL